MRLYTSPPSPFGRKVKVLLHETGQMQDVEVVNTTGTPIEPTGQPVGANPLGKIPALVLDDGSPIYDSRVICRYLDHRAGAGLYPEPPALWRVLTLEATADGILDAALLMVYEGRYRPDDLRFAPWVEGQWAKVARALDAVESQWLPHLSGPLDMGHLALACALGYLDLRHDARGWRTGRPRLADWYAAMATRDSLRATVPTV